MNAETSIKLPAVVTIRPMTFDDIPVIAGWIPLVALWQRYGLTTEQAARQLVDALQKGDLLLVTHDDQTSEPYGFAWCMPGGAFGRSAYLRLIGVHPDYTGTGIGARLLEHVETLTKQSSHSLFLLVSDFNVDAQRFYQRHGYEQVGMIPDYVLPGVAEFIFWKRLR